MSVLAIGSLSKLPNTNRCSSSLDSTSIHIHSLAPNCLSSTSILTWSPFVYFPMLPRLIKPAYSGELILRDTTELHSHDFCGDTRSADVHQIAKHAIDLGTCVDRLNQ